MVALAFISGAQSSTTNSQHHHQQSSISSSSSRGKLLSKRESSYDTASSLLSNINPWLSACDLAQPNLNSAPDLQVINHVSKKKYKKSEKKYKT